MQNQETHIEIKKIQQENDGDSLLQCLKQSYKIKINEKTNEPECVNATNEDVQVLKGIVIDECKQSNYLLAKEAIRCLRNCAIKNCIAQTSIVENQDLIQMCKAIVEEDTFPMDLKNATLILFINLSIGNPTNGRMLWELLGFNNLVKNAKLQDKVLALAYNIFLLNSNITPQMEFVIAVIENSKDETNHCEFSHFILDLFIKTSQISLFYDDIKQPEDRIVILQQLKDLQLKKEPIAWSKTYVDMLIRHFKTKSDCILKTVVDYVEKIEPFEVALLSDVIASMSSDENCLRMMQYDRSLLINCAFLLKSVHDAGKQGENHFAPIGKMAKAQDLKEDIEEHPAFGFRVNMIRILGNLAWKMRCNQDELRELEVIPLLLDCCNIDGRNPFITQWVVFAVHNLCENNLDNQKVIASLNKQGVVDSATLNELGLTLNDDGDNTIKIAPFNLK